MTVPPTAHGRRFAFGALAALGTACGLGDSGFRTGDQLQPDGPCWRVDLGDGLGDTSTRELMDLFACIDQEGALRPLAPTVAALDTPARDGTPAGVHVVRLVNHLPSADVDVWGLAGAALTLMDSDEPLVEPVLQTAVELLYGRPWGTVTASVTLSDPDELARGVLPPMLPLLGAAATALLDDAPGAPGLLADIVEDDAFADLTCTVVGIAETSDPAVRGIADRFMADLGVALARTRDPWNDRWRDATGDSARDLVTALLTRTDAAGDTLLEATEAPLGTILADVTLQHRLQVALEALVAGDHLDPLPLQLLYLAEVDATGAAVGAGDDSALLAFLRLLDQANAPMQCSLDLWVTDLEIDLGNLAVALLRVVARIDPATTETGVSILGAVLGWDLSRATLDLVADSGVCPLLDDQLVADLQAVDRFNDPEAGDLLIVLVEVLAAFVDAGSDEDKIPELVDVLGAAHGVGLVEPVEEVLRDTADTALMGDLTGAVAVLLDPTPLVVADCPTGSAPLDFAGTWGLLRAALVGGDQPAVLGTLGPVAGVFVEDDATWVALGNLSTLLEADASRTRALPDLVTRLLAADPDLALVRELAPLLRDPSLSRPLLLTAECAPLLDALGHTAVEDEGPLPFAARLVRDGTLQTALRTVDLVLDFLGGLDPATTDSEAR